jgi:hypothetical protein
VSSWVQPVSLMSMQQKPSVPLPWSLGSLHAPAVSSGVVPDGQVTPVPPPEQSRLLSALQPAGIGAPPLLPLPPPLLLLLSLDEHPSSAPEVPPPTTATANVNSNPLTVFQP